MERGGGRRWSLGLSTFSYQGRGTGWRGPGPVAVRAEGVEPPRRRLAGKQHRSARLGLLEAGMARLPGSLVAADARKPSSPALSWEGEQGEAAVWMALEDLS